MTKPLQDQPTFATPGKCTQCRRPAERKDVRFLDQTVSYQSVMNGVPPYAVGALIATCSGCGYWWRVRSADDITNGRGIE